MRRVISILLILALVFTAAPVFCEDIDEEEEMYKGYTGGGYVTLQKGDRDVDEAVDVLVMQQKLVEMGYLRDTADGVYGANTETAVAAFQRNNGLSETGIADPATQDKLLNGTDLVTADESMDAGSVVFRTQTKLAQWGFYDGLIDGVSGDATSKSVADFKAYLKGYYLVNPTPAPVEATPTPRIETSGYADGLLAEDELLVPEEEISYSGDIDREVLNFVDGEYEFVVYRHTVSNGETDDEVKRVQRRLHVLKYLARVDGEMNAPTERALLYFQKKNGLPLTGIADQETQEVLFSTAAVPAEEFVNAYKIVVDKTAQRVNVYQWNGTDYSMQVKSFICSTGLRGRETETPSGTFSAVGPSGTGEWYYFKKYECFAKWGYFIVGGIMFHSVIYSRGKSLNRTSVKKLGRRASHGCIRMEVESAKWIYDNCPAGTTVVIKD